MTKLWQSGWEITSCSQEINMFSFYLQRAMLKVNKISQTETKIDKKCLKLISMVIIKVLAKTVK